MKTLYLALAIFSLQTAIQSQVIKPQPLPEWFRVHTYDDSIVELNTKYVMFSDRKIERVRFRWSFLTPQTLNENTGIKYQSILQEIQFDCKNEKFRIYTVEWYDGSGKLVANESKKESEDWRAIRFGSMIEKLFTPACKLVELRKREPVLEP